MITRKVLGLRVPENGPAAIVFVAKLPGEFMLTICIALLLAVLHPRRLAGAISLMISGIVAGTFYGVIKWIAGRHRPVKVIDPFGFHPFPGGIRGLFHPEDALSFPSGHASLAFASAMCLTMLLPRWGWLFFAVATVTAVERVLENAHYVSDVVAGMGFGIATAWVITRTILSLGTPAQAASCASAGENDTP